MAMARGSALTTRFACFVYCPFVCVALFMGGFAAFTCDASLFLRIH